MSGRPNARVRGRRGVGAVVGACAALACVVGVAPGGAGEDDRPPFRVRFDVPQAGEAAMLIRDADGRQIRRLSAQMPRERGPGEEPWDLTDDEGRPVPPGRYTLAGICGPPVELHYQLTTCPNIQQLFADRVPWMMGHDSPHGWLSDHCQNWACATRGDRVYFGAPMAEAGVCLIECDLAGKKLWGKHDFGPWTGVNMLAADERALYIDRGGPVFRMDAATRQVRKIFQYGTNPERRGHASAMAARGSQVALAFTGEGLLDNATTADQVDLAHCLPKADGELVRLLRLSGAPPGRDVNPKAARPQGNGRLDLESTLGPEADQYAVIAFRSPVPLGSVVLPCPPLSPKLKVRLSVLKVGAPYPPRPREEDDWTAFPSEPRAGWQCLPAPPNTLTRALRVRFTRPAFDEGDWMARLEGLKLLRRRFADCFASARVRVNSGKLDADGAWDARRTEAVWHDRPGVYVLQWEAPRKLAGLAVKEIDGAVTEIDVWQGPPGGEVPLDGAALDRKSKAPGWRNVATYRQPRRSAQYSNDNNRFARYLDGYVDFGEPVETRALRLRVTEQWLDNNSGRDNAACRRHDGRSEHGLHFTQSYAAALDTRLCGVLGAAPLEHLGGEAPVEPTMYERVEIYDGNDGKLLKELPVRLGWHGLAFGPAGELYGIAKDHERIVRVDSDTGRATTVVADAQPHTMTVGPDGLIYVNPWSTDGRAPVQVYDARGRRVRSIGEPGGWRPGLWDARRLGPVHRMCVDRAGSLWVVESDNYPRRIVQFRTDGTFVKEIVGNTFYGGTGGGTMDRYDRHRAWYGRVEFELDWKTHTSRIRGLLAESLESPDIVALRVQGRKETYLVTAPLSLHPRQGHAAVYLYDEAACTARLVAAMGEASSFGPLRTSAVISRLGGGVPRDHAFVWSDGDADGQVGPDEVLFAKRPPEGAGVGPFDDQLGCLGPGVWYKVRQFLPDGTPLYERRPVSGRPHLRLADGRLFTLCGQRRDGGPTEDFLTGPDGAAVWSYPASAGVSGLHIPAWRPGQVTNELGVIGHETAPAGELGEFLVVHENTGQWKIWTADGLLAGSLLLHKTHPRARFLGPAEAPPGTRLDPLSANQEHFHGFFTRCEAGNRYYLIMGFTNMSLIEVVGLDRFRRFGAELTVTPADLRDALAWQARRARRAIAARGLLLKAARVTRPPQIDGRVFPEEWPAQPARLEGGLDASLAVAYDSDKLYLCWTCKDAGPLRNAGGEFQRIFRTGAGLDLLLATDPAADPDRTSPAKGDLRLLLTFVQAAPTAVLYQPVAPDAPTSQRWQTATAAGGKTAFDRVVRLSGVAMAMKGDKTFTVEAAVPLAALGLRPRAALVLKMDWGILTTSDGRQVKQRQYWANPTATGTADEAVEARLQPHLWGQLRLDPPPNDLAEP